MKEFLKRNKNLLTVSALVLLTFAVQLFIFSNSMKDAEASSAQSDKVAEIVRPPAEVILPQLDVEPSKSNISRIVRTAAHFSEFALLGCVAFFTVRSFAKKAWPVLLLPFLYAVLTAFLDEAIQLTSPGRAWQMEDILVDSAGAFCGILFAAALCALVISINKRLTKKQNHDTMQSHDC